MSLLLFLLDITCASPTFKKRKRKKTTDKYRKTKQKQSIMKTFHYLCNVARVSMSMMLPREAVEMWGQLGCGIDFIRNKALIIICDHLNKRRKLFAGINALMMIGGFG